MTLVHHLVIFLVIRISLNFLRVLISFHKATAKPGPFFDMANFRRVTDVASGSPRPVYIATSVVIETSQRVTFLGVTGENNGAKISGTFMLWA